MIELTLFWLLGAVVVGIAARGRGRSGIGWALLAFVLSPLLAGFLVLALPSRSAAARALEAEAPAEKTHARCPACREMVRRDAVKCRYCGAVLEPRVDEPEAGRPLSFFDEMRAPGRRPRE